MSKTWKGQDISKLKFSTSKSIWKKATPHVTKKSELLSFSYKVLSKEFRKALSICYKLKFKPINHNDKIQNNFPSLISYNSYLDKRIRKEYLILLIKKRKCY